MSLDAYTMICLFFSYLVDERRHRYIPRLLSHGRGHWFDPSTAHQKSRTYKSRQRMELRTASGKAACITIAAIQMET